MSYAIPNPVWHALRYSEGRATQHRARLFAFLLRFIPRRTYGLASEISIIVLAASVAVRRSRIGGATLPGGGGGGGGAFFASVFTTFSVKAPVPFRDRA